MEPSAHLDDAANAAKILYYGYRILKDYSRGASQDQEKETQEHEEEENQDAKQ